MSFAFSFGNQGFGESRLRKTLLKHFGAPAGEIATVGRQFPITARVDIQAAIEQILQNRSGTTLLGILSPHHHEPPSLAQTLGGGAHFPIDIGPIQHDEIDIGEAVPARCLEMAFGYPGTTVCRLPSSWPREVVLGSGAGSKLKLPSRPANVGRSSPRNCFATWNYL